MFFYFIINTKQILCFPYYTSLREFILVPLELQVCNKYLSGNQLNHLQLEYYLKIHLSYNIMKHKPFPYQSRYKSFHLFLLINEHIKTYDYQHS